MPHAHHLPGCSASSFEECRCEANRYALGLAITILIFCVQVIGGLWAHSLALLADSAHVLSDASAYGLSIYVALHVRRRADQHDFRVKYMRVSCLLLLAAVVWILVAAGGRLLEPPNVAGPILTGFAIAGGIGNAAQVVLIHGGARTLTSRAQMLHVLGDLGSSVVVVAGGVVVWLTGWYLVDPVLSILIACFIGWSTLKFLTEKEPEEPCSHH